MFHFIGNKRVECVLVVCCFIYDIYFRHYSFNAISFFRFSMIAFCAPCRAPRTSYTCHIYAIAYSNAICSHCSHAILNSILSTLPSHFLYFLITPLFLTCSRSLYPFLSHLPIAPTNGVRIERARTYVFVLHS